jgi:putative acetyltransferase
MIDDDDMEVRWERLSEHTAISDVNREAFGGSTEAELVEALRTKTGCISLVAASKHTVVGHILFTPVEVIGSSGTVRVAGLGPMAVRPPCQRKGVGSRLVRQGLEECRRSGYEAVVVGHPEYYPRFGFIAASRFGLRCEFDAPDEAFMALELRSGALHAGGGMVRYSVELYGR